MFQQLPEPVVNPRTNPPACTGRLLHVIFTYFLLSVVLLVESLGVINAVAMLLNNMEALLILYEGDL